MDILEKTKEIIAKHNVVANSLSFNPFKARRESKSGGCGWEGEGVIGFNNSPEFKDSYWKSTNLQNKYQNRVPPQWYGFDIDCWPVNWIDALEEFLAELEKDSPDFEIHIVKLKYGTARIHIDNVSKEAYDSIDLLEEVMQDNNLIY